MPVKSQGNSSFARFIGTEKAVHSSTGLTNPFQKRKVKGIVYIPLINIYDCEHFRWMSTFRESQPKINRLKLQSSLVAAQSLPPTQRYYCYQCSILFFESDLMSHSGHFLTKEISDEVLLKPTKLITPVDDRKSQAVSALAWLHV